MEYSENPIVNDTCLTVINDGNGEMCGYDYQQRKTAARSGNRSAFRHMARNYGRYRLKHFDSRNLTRPEWVEAGDILFEYYLEHIRECES